MEDYIVLEGRTASELAERVKAQMSKGWRLQGGVSVAISSHSTPSHYSPGHLNHSNALFAQAMVK